MSQNRSSAVMQQRKEPHDSLDDYPTPPWATRALLEHIDGPFGTVREPAANRGHMARPLGESFKTVLASDIFDYGVGYEVWDYIFGPSPSVDWTITNPPFRLAQRFIEKALDESEVGVAVFVRSAFLEGIGRHRDLFSTYPPAMVLQFVERVVLHKGKLAPKGSSATAYCWIVWRLPNSPFRPTELRWIPPCRRRLEREEDYS